MSEVNENRAGENARYLSFTLGKEEYGVPLLSVKEVIALPEITPVPQAPTHFLGIMNLRGQVISIMDLRKKLNIQASHHAETAVIICDVDKICIGLVVDSINAVLAPSRDDLSAKPDGLNKRNSDYITGVYRKEKGMVLFLDIPSTLSGEDRKALQEKAA